MSDIDRFYEALDKVASDQSPRAEMADLDPEEQRMVHMAQLIHGSRAPTPDREFVARLHDRVIPLRHRVSRRAAFISGVGALAAGVLAGVGLDRSVGGKSNQDEVAKTLPPIVGQNGRWFQVARVADVPEGAVHAFNAGAVRGYVINHGGSYRAISRICTHMGCTLDFSAGEQSFVCPCHGAEFELTGELRYGSGGYGTTWPVLSPLPPVRVRVNGEHLEVWSV